MTPALSLAFIGSASVDTAGERAGRLGSEALSFAAKVWLRARAMGVNGRKPRLAKFSKRSGPLPARLLLFRMVDERRRIGIVYWVQRKRYWTLARKLEVLAGIYPANVPTLGEALQDKLRHRVYRMRRPGLWQQQRLWVDARLHRVPVGPDGVRPAPSGVQPGQTGENGDATRMAVGAESVQSSHDNAAPSQVGGAGNQTLTASGARATLAAFLVKSFGGGR